MAGTLHHVALLTNNPKRLKSFYIKKLNFRVEKESVAPKKLMKRIFGFDSDCRLIMLNRKDVRLELISLTAGSFKIHASTGRGYSHWAYLVKDKVRFCKTHEAKGVKVIRAIKNSRPIFFIKDPDGNRIEIQQL
jgi:catechol 2,3-dioxygenase-like lactoylglutathione lyase family enzyme